MNMELGVGEDHTPHLTVTDSGGGEGREGAGLSVRGLHGGGERWRLTDGRRQNRFQLTESHVMDT